MARVSLGPPARFTELPAHRQGLVAVLGAAALWSTGGLFIKSLDIGATGITMWRSLFAGLTILVLMRPRLVAPWRMGWTGLGLVLSYAAMLLLFVTATRLTTAANAIFLQFTAPLYLLLFGRFFLSEPVSRIDLGAVALALAGMALFFVGKLEAEDVAGNACAIGSGVAFAVFLILLRLPGTTNETRVQSMVAGNALLFVTLAVVNAFYDTSMFTPSGGDWLRLVFLGVIQIGFAYALFTFGIAHVPALEASLIGMLEPVLNPVWVFLFLGESPGWWAAAGGAVIIAAVVGRTVLVERKRSALARAEFGVLSAET